MTYHVREDGTYTFFTVEFAQPRNGDMTDWHCVGDILIAKIPSELRFNDARNGSMNEPYREFSACGDIWQKTLNHGFVDMGAALSLASALSRYNPMVKFRVVKVHVSLGRLAMATYVSTGY